jgi:hypothetical protein
MTAIAVALRDKTEEIEALRDRLDGLQKEIAGLKSVASDPEVLALAMQVYAQSWGEAVGTVPLCADTHPHQPAAMMAVIAAITPRIRAVALREAIAAAQNVALTDSYPEPDDMAYNRAVGHVVEALRVIPGCPP